MSVDLVSDWGTRSTTDLAPGAKASHAFTTRQAALPAGSVTATISAEGASVVRVAEHGPASCS